MRSRTSLGIALCAALAAGACGDGGATPPPAGSGPGSSDAPSSVPGPPAAGATFRACHRHRDGSLVLILLFDVRDRSAIGGFAGAVAFDVATVDPAVWTTTGRPVAVGPGENPHVRHIGVPAGEPPPSELLLRVTTTAAVDPSNLLATNEVRIPVPASSCSAA